MTKKNGANHTVTPGLAEAARLFDWIAKHPSEPLLGPRHVYRRPKPELDGQLCLDDCDEGDR